MSRERNQTAGRWKVIIAKKWPICGHYWVTTRRVNLSYPDWATVSPGCCSLVSQPDVLGSIPGMVNAENADGGNWSGIPFLSSIFREFTTHVHYPCILRALLSVFRTLCLSLSHWPVLMGACARAGRRSRKWVRWRCRGAKPSNTRNEQQQPRWQRAVGNLGAQYQIDSHRNWDFHNEFLKWLLVQVSSFWEDFGPCNFGSHSKLHIFCQFQWSNRQANSLKKPPPTSWRFIFEATLNLFIARLLKRPSSSAKVMMEREQQTTVRQLVENGRPELFRQRACKAVKMGFTNIWSLGPRFASCPSEEHDKRDENGRIFNTAGFCFILDGNGEILCKAIGGLIPTSLDNKATQEWLT